jgi:hypothetical protein
MELDARGIQLVKVIRPEISGVSSHVGHSKV